MEDKQVRAMWAAIRRIESAVKELKATNGSMQPTACAESQDDAPAWEAIPAIPNPKHRASEREATKSLAEGVRYCAQFLGSGGVEFH
ncbi:MAG: hypothetical protein Q8P50_02445 [Bacillota bacterium]|nr:hypothetical protein [Bacillota bacterium]